MLRSLLPVVIVASQLGGCVVYTSDRSDPPPRDTHHVNSPPYMIDADAGCYWDSYYGDDIWYFQAWANDPDGPYDVVSVWADVYDEWGGGWHVETFELFATDDPVFWFSDWFGSTTWLDCFYGGYTVDFVVYDSRGQTDVFTVWAYTYGN